MKKILLLIIAFFVFVLPIQAEPITNDAKLEYNHGIDYYKNGEYDKAMASFRRAINYSPDYIDAYYNLGAILEYLNQYDYALEMFKQIILRNPEDSEAVYKAGQMALKIGDYAQATEYLNLVPIQSKYYNSAIKLLNQIGNQKSSSVQKHDNNNFDTNLFENLLSPTGVASDVYGNIYIAHYNTNTITKIACDNTKSVYVKDTKINGPVAMTIDIEGNLYVSNYNSGNVIKIKQNKEVSVLIGNLKKPYGLFLRDDILYISLQGQNAVLKYRLKV